MAISSFYEGTTKVINYILADEDGNIQNITSDTVRFIVKASPSTADGSAVIDTNADVTTDGAQGKATITLTSALTSVQYGSYYYEVLWTRSTGEVYVVESERLTIKQRVTDV